MRESLIAYLVSVIVDIIVLGATWYAVFILGASGWWFLLAIIICASEVPSTVGRK